MISNKNIIFVNTHCYLTFEEIAAPNKGHFTLFDFLEAYEGVNQEDVFEDFYDIKGSLRAKITKSDWLEYIKKYDKSLNSLHKYRKLQLSAADRKNIRKTCTKKIYKTDALSIIKPLTYESMVVYGYQTKWCCSSVNTSEHYDEAIRSKKGLYIITNNRRKHKKEYYKFLLYIERPSLDWTFFNEQNKLLTTKTSYDINMNIIAENDAVYMNFLYEDKLALTKITEDHAYGESPYVQL